MLIDFELDKYDISSFNCTTIKWYFMPFDDFII